MARGLPLTLASSVGPLALLAPGSAAGLRLGRMEGGQKEAKCSVDDAKRVRVGDQYWESNQAEEMLPKLLEDEDDEDTYGCLKAYVVDLTKPHEKPDLQAVLTTKSSQKFGDFVEAQFCKQASNRADKQVFRHDPNMAEIYRGGDIIYVHDLVHFDIYVMEYRAKVLGRGAYHSAVMLCWHMPELKTHCSEVSYGYSKGVNAEALQWVPLGQGTGPETRWNTAHRVMKVLTNVKGKSIHAALESLTKHKHSAYGSGRYYNPLTHNCNSFVKDFLKTLAEKAHFEEGEADDLKQMVQLWQDKYPETAEMALSSEDIAKVRSNTLQAHQKKLDSLRRTSAWVRTSAERSRWRGTQSSRSASEDRS